MSILLHERRSVKPSPSPKSIQALAQLVWERACRVLLGNLRYSALDADAACRWFSFRSTFRACPVISPRDAALLDGAAAKALTEELEAEADAQVDGDVQSDPADWPAWTTAHRYEASDADRRWHAEDSDRRSRASSRRRPIHPNNALNFRAAESRAVDAHERGLLSPDEAESIMGRSLLGHPG